MILMRSGKKKKIIALDEWNFLGLGTTEMNAICAP